jgi:hypothetical protein
LSSYQSKHVLTTAQQSLPGCIVDISLRLVEALESGLLAFAKTISIVGLQKRGVEESQEGVETTRVLFIFFLRGLKSYGEYNAN